jgi:hypothetical protein
MISDYMKTRQIMAENGYEHTPAEAKKMVGEFNKAIEKFSMYENYILLQNMTEQEIINYAEKCNMAVDEFEELRSFILDIVQ